MRFEYSYTPEDLQALNRFANRWWDVAVVPGACFLAAVPGALLGAWLGHEFLALAGMAVAVGVGVVWRHRMLRNAQSEAAAIERETSDRIILTDEFLCVCTPQHEERWRWSCIDEASEFEDWMMLRMGTGYWIVPCRRLSSREDMGAIQQGIRERMLASRTLRDDATESDPPPGSLPVDSVRFEICFRMPSHEERAALAPFSHPTLGARCAGGLFLFSMGAFFQFQGAVEEVQGPVAEGLAASLVGLGLSIGSLIIPVTITIGEIIEWWRRHPDPVAELSKRLQFSRDRVTISTRLYDMSIAWEGFQAVSYDDRYVYFVWLRPRQTVLLVPKAAFPNGEEANAFCEFAVGCHAEAYLPRDSGSLTPEFPPLDPKETKNPYQSPRTEPAALDSPDAPRSE